jgi:hypothetical protein
VTVGFCPRAAGGPICVSYHSTSGHKGLPGSPLRPNVRHHKALLTIRSRVLLGAGWLASIRAPRSPPSIPAPHPLQALTRHTSDTRIATLGCSTIEPAPPEVSSPRHTESPAHATATVQFELQTNRTGCDTMGGKNPRGTLHASLLRTETQRKKPTAKGSWSSPPHICPTQAHVRSAAQRSRSATSRGRTEFTHFFRHKRGQGRDRPKQYRPT